jgi:glycosyltransferase involved in cell wall biosynthesis
LREADLYCFPTRYPAENQPVTLIEAMAFGLPIVTTRWRSIPEMFPPGYPGLVADQSTEPIADALLALMTVEIGEELRGIFLRSFTLERYLTGLAEAFAQVEAPRPVTLSAAAASPAPR